MPFSIHILPSDVVTVSHLWIEKGIWLRISAPSLWKSPFNRNVFNIEICGCLTEIFRSELLLQSHYSFINNYGILYAEVIFFFCI